MIFSKTKEEFHIGSVNIGLESVAVAAARVVGYLPVALKRNVILVVVHRINEKLIISRLRGMDLGPRFHGPYQRARTP